MEGIEGNGEVVQTERVGGDGGVGEELVRKGEE